MSIRSTSISSISSGKSLVSNFSVKSDSGIGSPSVNQKGTATVHQRSRHKSASPASSNLQHSTERSARKDTVPLQCDPSYNKTHPPSLPPRHEFCHNWESEPHLDQLDYHQQQQQKMTVLSKLKRGGSAEESSIMEFSKSVDSSENTPHTSTQQSASTFER